MILGFIIWSLVCIGLLAIGVTTWRSRKPTGFFTGVKAPKVKNVQIYNRYVAILWIGYAVVIEFLGIPLLFLKQNSAFFILIIFGVVMATIVLIIIYLCIEKKCRSLSK